MLRNLSRPISAIKTTSASLPAPLTALSRLYQGEEGARVWLSGVVQFPVVPSHLIRFRSFMAKKFFRPDLDSSSLPPLPRSFSWIPNVRSPVMSESIFLDREPASTRLMPEGFRDPVMAVFTSINSISLYTRVICPDGSLAVYLANEQAVGCSSGAGHLQRSLNSITITLTSTAGEKTYTFALSKLKCAFSDDPQSPIDCLEVVRDLIPYARYAVSIKFHFLDTSNKEVIKFSFSFQFENISKAIHLRSLFWGGIMCVLRRLVMCTICSTLSPLPHNSSQRLLALCTVFQTQTWVFFLQNFTTVTVLVFYIHIDKSLKAETTTEQAIAAIETPSPTGTGFFRS